MTKAQLEEKINEIIEKNSKERQGFINRIRSLEKELEDTKKSYEESKYIRWKSINEKYLKMYLLELLPDIISVECDTDWGGDITVNLLVGDKVASSSSGTVVTRHNPLDE